MIATLNGVEVCRSGAIYSGPSTTPGDQGALSAMQYCNKSIKVKKGDIMTLEANYDLELHPPRMQHGVSPLSLPSRPRLTDNEIGRNGWGNGDHEYILCRRTYESELAFQRAPSPFWGSVMRRFILWGECMYKFN